MADPGCGTGRMTGHLRQSGAEVSGIGLSPGVVAVARVVYPGLRFEAGSTTGLGPPGGSLGGALSRHSTVPLDETELAVFCGEFAHALAPGRLLLLTFEASRLRGFEASRLRGFEASR
ncbi:methyltransferase domain-containing protein [Streptomyces sp. NPDC047974]|uniref:methyltransferase domain-containing protein n=1 Tax=Streptomyces sp. NPDC047974 TaxID=3154343 RepID=UPI0033D52D23